jgi:hypothetical protein
MPPRYYTSTALPTNLTGSIDDAVTSISVAALDGYPGATPFTIAVDYDSANEELMDVTGVAGTTLTVTRAVDGTSATSHSAGAVVRHVTSARDFREFQSHIDATSNVHGVTGALVGTTNTQTLSNKTLDRAKGSMENATLYSEGASGWTSVVGSSAFPALPKQVWYDDEINLRQIVQINSSGITMQALPDDTNSTIKFVVVDQDGSSIRMRVAADGTVRVAPNGSTTNSALSLTVPDTSTSKRTIRMSDETFTNDRLVVWNDGRVDMKGTDPGFSVLDVWAAPAHATSIFRVGDNAEDTKFQITSAGQARALAGTRTSGPNASSVPMIVDGTAGQTADLQQWRNSSLTNLARVSSAGRVISADGFTGPSFNTDLTSASGSPTAASGWTVSASNAVVRSGIIHWGVTMTRTGAGITPTSAGNILEEPLICTIPSGWRPAGMGSRLLQGTMSNGVGDGAVRLGSDNGECRLSTWSTGGKVTGNSTDPGADNDYRFNFCYPI